MTAGGEVDRGDKASAETGAGAMAETVMLQDSLGTGVTKVTAA